MLANSNLMGSRRSRMGTSISSRLSTAAPTDSPKRSTFNTGRLSPVRCGVSARMIGQCHRYSP